MSDTRRVSLLMGRRRHTGEIKLAVFIKMLIRRRLNLIDKLDINGHNFRLVVMGRLVEGEWGALMYDS